MYSNAVKTKLRMYLCYICISRDYMIPLGNKKDEKKIYSSTHFMCIEWSRIWKMSTIDVVAWSLIFVRTFRPIDE